MQKVLLEMQEHLPTKFQKMNALLVETIGFVLLGILLYVWYMPFISVPLSADDVMQVNMAFEWSFFDSFTVAVNGVHYRPIHAAFAWITVRLFEFKIQYYFILNILINVLISFTVYRFLLKLTCKKAISMAVAYLYAVANFGLLGLTQVIGPIELLPLWMEMVIVLRFYDILTSEGNKLMRSCLLVIVCYAIAIHCHERFFVLILPILVVFFMRRHQLGKKLKSLVFLIALPLAFNIIMKKFVLHLTFFQGTAAQPIKTDFHTIIFHAVKHIGYMLGIHNTDAYLSGSWIFGIPTWVYIPVIISILCVAIVVVLYIKTVVITSHVQSETTLKSIKLSILYFLTIGVNIASSSATFRVETRWVYAPFAVALIWIVYMVNFIYSNRCDLLNTDTKQRKTSTAKLSHIHSKQYIYIYIAWSVYYFDFFVQCILQI
jgi:hypothetical protein